jgi:hypothetical protein
MPHTPVAATLRLQLSLSYGFCPQKLSLMLLEEGSHAPSIWEWRLESMGIALLIQFTAATYCTKSAPFCGSCIVCSAYISFGETYPIIGYKTSTIPHRGLKKHALAGVQVKSMLMTVFENENES